MHAVLVGIASANHACIGCFEDSVCIRVVAHSTLLCNRNHEVETKRRGDVLISGGLASSSIRILSAVFISFHLTRVPHSLLMHRGEPSR